MAFPPSKWRRRTHQELKRQPIADVKSPEAKLADAGKVAVFRPGFMGRQIVNAAFEQRTAKTNESKRPTDRCEGYGSNAKPDVTKTRCGRKI